MPKKKTHNEFIDEVYNLIGNEYTVLGMYKNGSSKIKMRHNSNTCRYSEFDMTPADFKKGQRCPECWRMKNKKSHEEFVQELYDKVGLEYSVMSLYKGNKEKITIRHNNESCNYYEWSSSPNDILTNNKLCPKCAVKTNDNTQWNHDKFFERVSVITNNEYKVMGNFQTMTTDIMLYHETCHTKFSTKPYNFLRRQICPKCTKRKNKKSNNDFIKEVHSLVGDEYTILGNYVNNSTKIKMRHNSIDCDNYEWNANPVSFLSGSRCPKCSGLYNETHGEFIDSIRKLVGDEYTVLSEFSSLSNKIKMRHNCDKCNNYEWEVRANNFKNKGYRCPECNRISEKTLGEKAVEEYLLCNKYNYVMYKTFDDCRNIGLLSFDFYVPDRNLLIEFDGKQHLYGWNDCEDSLNKQKIRDRIKDKYCIDNNIDLLRIAYTEINNVEVILDKYFNNMEFDNEDIVLYKENSAIINGVYRTIIN